MGADIFRSGGWEHRAEKVGAPREIKGGGDLSKK